MEPKLLSEWIFAFGGDSCRVDQAQTLESQLEDIKQIVDDYLEKGEGGGGRRICIRIRKVMGEFGLKSAASADQSLDSTKR